MKNNQFCRENVPNDLILGNSLGPVHSTPPEKILFFQKQVPSEVILIMFLLSSLHLLTYL